MAKAVIHLDIISENYRKLAKKAGAGPLLPVVKTGAYGMGLLPVALTLHKSGCKEFCAGSMDEAGLLRGEIPDSTIIAMFGAQTPAEWQKARACGIIPLVHNKAGLASALQHGVKKIAVKIEGGMHRTGFADIAELHNIPLDIQYIMTHLPCADDPAKKAETEAQIASFMEKARALQAKYPQAQISIGASAGLLEHNSMPEGTALRCGIALYTEYGGLGTRDALELSAPVISVHNVRKGESVSYGGKWTAKTDARIATVLAGYADGLPRSASGRLSMIVDGRRERQVGTICMNMSMLCLDAASPASPDTAWLTGNGQSIADLSAMTGQTAYEILCIYGRLNPREYRGQQWA